MRLGVWLPLAAALVGSAPACSGGYPLPPTRCDEWCDATRGHLCERYYDPASCVSSCERNHLGVDACQQELDADVACFRARPGSAAAACDFFSSLARPCAAEGEALSACGNVQRYLAPQPNE